MKRPGGLRGITEVGGKWKAEIRIHGRGRRKGKGKMQAAADDGGVSSSDEEAARQLEEQQELIRQRACQESFLAAGPTGSSSGSGSASAFSGSGSSG
jgi:hypothetical protein